MRYVKILRRRPTPARKATWLAAAVAAIGLAGCLTVVPDKVQPKQASIDGNVANSGLIGTNALGEFVITQGAYERFEWLRQHYGSRLRPPLVAGVGVAPNPEQTNTWVMDGERLVDFEEMTYMANNPSK